MSTIRSYSPATQSKLKQEARTYLNSKRQAGNGNNLRLYGSDHQLLCEVIPTMGDGNCLFRAIAQGYANDGVGPRSLEEENALQENLRKLACDYQKLPPTAPMRKSRVWGDDMEIVALSNILKKSIIRLRLANGQVIAENFDFANKGLDDAIIIHYDNSHYSAVVLASGVSSKKFFESISSGQSYLKKEQYVPVAEVNSPVPKKKVRFDENTLAVYQRSVVSKSTAPTRPLTVHASQINQPKNHALIVSAISPSIVLKTADYGDKAQEIRVRVENEQRVVATVEYMRTDCSNISIALEVLLTNYIGALKPGCTPMVSAKGDKNITTIYYLLAQALKDAGLPISFEENNLDSVSNDIINQIKTFFVLPNNANSKDIGKKIISYYLLGGKGIDNEQFMSFIRQLGYTSSTGYTVYQALTAQNIGLFQVMHDPLANVISSQGDLRYGKGNGAQLGQLQQLMLNFNKIVSTSGNCVDGLIQELNKFSMNDSSQSVRSRLQIR